MAEQKKNPTPSLLAGTPAPGSNGNAPRSAPEKFTGPAAPDAGPATDSREGPGTYPPKPPKGLRLAGRPPRGPRIALQIVLEGDSLALLLRNVPDGETPDSAARRWLLKALGDLEDSLLPLEGEENPDPRRGLRALPGGRSDAGPPDLRPLLPCA